MIEFRQIEGATEGYLCSNTGEIKSPSGIILKQYLNPSNNYLECYSNHLPTSLVHRLVMYAFHGMNKSMVVDHIDRNRQNNCLENLRYCTQKENVMNGENIVKFYVFDKIANKTIICNSFSKFQEDYPSIHISYSKLKDGFENNCFKYGTFSMEEFSNIAKCSIENTEVIIMEMEGNVLNLDIKNTSSRIYNQVFSCTNEKTKEVFYFKSKTFAGKYLGIDPSGISKALRGKLKKVKGFICKYETNDIKTID